MPRIEEWSFGLPLGTDGFTAPECVPLVLRGKVFGHPLHEDGTFLSTSTPVRRRGEIVITRTGTEYELGVPAEEYERQCPDARARMLAVLPEESK